MNSKTTARQALKDSTAMPPPALAEAEVQTLSVTINRAVEITGVPRSGIYEQIAAGKLQVARVGRRTLVTMASLREMIAQGVKAREAEVADRVADYRARAAKRQAGKVVA